MGYTKALLNNGTSQYGYIDTTVRDHDRIMIDDF
jgi:hypothetical protein